jgi:diguanylate cyclase (GGDEF)-like protein
MEHVLELVPSPAAGIYLASDVNEGGLSESHITVVDGLVTLDCRTHLSDVFAYCGFKVPLTTKGLNVGLDFSRYSTVELTLSFESSIRDTVFLYLLNDETLKDEKVTRVNILPLTPIDGNAIYTKNMNDFSVPSWWLMFFAKDQSDSQVNVNNVVALHLTTGDNREAKVAQLALGTIRFTGKWISASSLYFYLLLGGLVILIGRGVASLLTYRSELKQSREHAVQLNHLNMFLSVERDKFEGLSKTDSLTACLNREGARAILERLITDQRHVRRVAHAALIILDIDKFKVINDSHGHDVGDRVLVKLTQFVRENIRQQDTFARWGGEEFVLICPQTSQKQAAVIAEKLRAGISALDFDLPKPITCSFGVAQLQGSDIEVWFKNADKALYQAKEQGRNRVVIA